MDTVILKFGGSSVADNIKLNVVANKIKEFYDRKDKIVVVVSAQGKTTDNLLKEASLLSNIPNERELDVLLSSGEQIAMAKLAILLNRLKMPAISLTGWQAGIYTSKNNQNATIKDIDVSRIEAELEKKKIVIVAGFQGINENFDITTLGRGGSDTTAVAIAAKLKANHCYIFSDVDGVYTTDPNQVKLAKKIDTISYSEMLDISDEGAKVLHNRCVEIGEKFNIPIVAKSTFKNGSGTVINDQIEGAIVKNIVKNDNIVLVHCKSENYSIDLLSKLYSHLVDSEIGVKNLLNNSSNNFDIEFTILKAQLSKLDNLIETKFPILDCVYKDISRISVIGNGIMSNNAVLKKVTDILTNLKLEVFSIEVNESKISIMFKEIVSNDILENLHNSLID